MKNENELSRIIIECGIETHRSLGGTGLLESVYEEALVYELKEKGVDVQRQVSLPIEYKGNELGNPLRIDLIVDELVII